VAKTRVSTLEADVETQKAATKKAKQERKAVKKEAEERLEKLQAQAKESEQSMVSAMESEVHKVLAEKEAEYEKLRAADLKSLKKMKKAQQGNNKALANVGAMAVAAKQGHSSLRESVASSFAGLSKDAASWTSAVAKRLAAEQAGVVALQKNYRREYDERRRLFNLVQELRGNIRVFCRCRPPSKTELQRDTESGGAVCVSFPEEGSIRVENDRGKEKTWEFDQVFDFNSKQNAVYAEVSPLVTSVLDGYNACIFAYGQTGSGKTYTMTGPDKASQAKAAAKGEGAEMMGVNTRALEELFTKSASRSSEIKDTISVSVLEIYCEQIRDLLAENVGQVCC
jgi:kinesin family protein C2/C3